MCITEYNEEETMQMFKEEGRKEGRKEGKMDAALNIMKNLRISPEKALEAVGFAENEREKYLQLLKARM